MEMPEIDWEEIVLRVVASYALKWLLSLSTKPPPDEVKKEKVKEVKKKIKRR